MMQSNGNKFNIGLPPSMPNADPNVDQFQSIQINADQF